MNFKIYKDVEAYCGKVKGFLEEEEVVNNLPLGLLQNLLKPKELQTQVYEDEPLLTVVEDNGQLVLVLLMTPPYNLYVYGKGPKLEDAIIFAVKELSKIYSTLPGAIGPKDVAEIFVNEWTEEMGVEAVIEMNQRIYQLTEVKTKEYSPGKLREVTQKDVPLLADWIHEFSKVTLGALPEDDCLRRAKKMVELGTAYVWEDGGEAVSMANKTRPNKNGITVSFVYTPPTHQRKGYASSCVAALSQLLLDEGYKYCTLYTDLENPTSNSIYMKIGYEPIRDSVSYKFA